MPKKLNVIAVPYDGCNLACKYCFFDPETIPEIMDSSTLETMTRETMTHPGIEDLWFLWHGGEATLAGLDFFKEALEIQEKFKRDDLHVRNSLQSNGTTLDEELLEFFIENKISIGFSLDGPKDLHDENRPRVGGQGSYDRIIQSIELMREYDQYVGFLAVVTRLSLGRAEEIYNHLTGLGDKVRFNPIKLLGRGIDVKDSLSITPREYSLFLREIFELWKNDKRRTKIVNPFAEFINDCLSDAPSTCTNLVSCAEEYIHVAPNGDVYSCGSFFGNPDFHYGNIADGLQSVLDSPKRKRIIEIRSMIEDCKGCEIKPVCNSGCLASSYMNGGIDQKDYWCGPTQVVYRLVDEAIVNVIKSSEV